MIVNPLAKIKEKKIPLIKLGVSSRTFFHWKKENILFENTEPDDTKQKVFLNLMDATWLMIIVEFRKYNIDLKTIKTSRDLKILSTDEQFNKTLFEIKPKMKKIKSFSYDGTENPEIKELFNEIF